LRRYTWELLTAGDAQEAGLHDSDSELVDGLTERDVPDEFDVPLYSPGPLLDVMTISEGASYLTKADVKGGDWDVVLDAVRELPGYGGAARPQIDPRLTPG
jgi:hypothetical protein